MEWFGVEQTFPLDQVSQGPMQPGLEFFWEWGIRSFSEQPVSVLHHPHSEEFCYWLSIIRINMKFITVRI